MNKRIESALISILDILTKDKLVYKVNYNDGKRKPIYIPSIDVCREFLSHDGLKELEKAYDHAQRVPFRMDDEMTYPSFSILLDENDEYWLNLKEDERAKVFRTIGYLKKFDLLKLNFLSIIGIDELTEIDKKGALLSIECELHHKMKIVNNLESSIGMEKQTAVFSQGVVNFTKNIVKSINNNVNWPMVDITEEKAVEVFDKDATFYIQTTLNVNSKDWHKNAVSRTKIIDQVANAIIKLNPKIELFPQFDTMPNVYLIRKNDPTVVPFRMGINEILIKIGTANEMKDWIDNDAKKGKDGKYICIMFKKNKLDAIGCDEDAGLLPVM